jgi:hypothetical protein
VIAIIRKLAKRARRITSVCTGAFLQEWIKHRIDVIDARRAAP